MDTTNGISFLAKQNKPIETHYIDSVLAPLLQPFRVSANKNKFAKQDCLVDIGDNRQFKIELEADHNSTFGRHDARYMSGSWSHFNFCDRKDASNFDLFIRFASKGNGFWAVNKQYLQKFATQPQWLSTTNAHLTPDNWFRRVPMPKNGLTYHIAKSGERVPAVFVWDDYSALQKVIHKLIQRM